MYTIPPFFKKSSIFRGVYTNSAIFFCAYSWIGAKGGNGLERGGRARSEDPLSYLTPARFEGKGGRLLKRDDSALHTYFESASKATTNTARRRETRKDKQLLEGIAKHVRSKVSRFRFRQILIRTFRVKKNPRSASGAERGVIRYPAYGYRGHGICHEEVVGGSSAFKRVSIAPSSST